MKLGILLCVLLSALATQAQTNLLMTGNDLTKTNAQKIRPVYIPKSSFTNSDTELNQTNRFAPELLARRRAFIAKYHPLKVLGGKLYDFTEFFITRNSQDEETAEEQFRNWIVVGKVLQVTGDGLLVKLSTADRVVLLKNYSKEQMVVDDSPIKAFVQVSGRYQYVNTQGATATIIAYDCARRFDPQKDEFKEKIIVRVGGNVNSPVTEWDLQ